MKEFFQKKLSNLATLVLAVIVLAGAMLISMLGIALSKKSEPEIITASTLEKIINISELSTFQTVYNGVAEVKNEKKAEKTDYYVSYEAVVQAGIDFEKIDIEVDNYEKIVTVTLPEVFITEVNVRIESLDFMFENSKANASSVTKEAFQACQDDVKGESGQQAAIFDSAHKNAVRIITALIEPFIEQLDDEYDLIVK